MTRLAARLEGLDDEHAAAATRTRSRERLCRIGLGRLLGRVLRFHAGMSGPVGSLVEAMLRNMSMSH